LFILGGNLRRNTGSYFVDGCGSVMVWLLKKNIVLRGVYDQQGDGS
jgi:hypothetical protein